MKMPTRICNLLNIQYPILQGGMAWVATGELAAAVSEAGGLGIIGSGNAPANVVAHEIKKVKEITGKPFGVNIMLLSPFAEEVVRVVLEERVPVVTTGAGSPGKFISAFKEKGIKVMPVVSSVALAKRLERQGVDALIAEGIEAGGHVGELTTLVLVPQVVDAVTLPVVAAGGIADARGFVASIALGAQGVQIGTRFVCAAECTVHDNYKNFLIKAKDRDTVVLGHSTGHPVRVLKNKLAREFAQMEKRSVPKEQMEAFGTGKLAAAVQQGDIAYGSVMAGQAASMVNKIEKAADIIEEIMQGAKKIFSD